MPWSGAVERIGQVEHLAEHVDLGLGGGGVADAHRASAPVTAPLGHLDLGRRKAAVDPEHRGRGSRLAGAAAEVAERGGGVGQAEAEHGQGREGGVAQPGEAVVPGSRGAGPLRQRGGRRGDDPPAAVGQAEQQSAGQFEQAVAQRGAQDPFRQTRPAPAHRRRPPPPGGGGGLEQPRGRRAHPAVDTVSGGRGEHQAQCLAVANLEAGLDPAAGRPPVEGWRDQHRPPAASGVHRGGGDGQPVRARRPVAHHHLDRPAAGAGQPCQPGRPLGDQRLRHLQMGTGAFPVGLQQQGARSVVAGAGATTGRAHREAAAGHLVDDATQHRQGVDPRPGQPGNAALGIDQGGGAATGEQGVVTDVVLHRSSLGGGPSTSAGASGGD